MDHDHFEFEALRKAGKSWRQIAKLKGFKHYQGIMQSHNKWKKNNPFELQQLPCDDVPIHELIAARKRKFSIKKEYEEAAKLVQVKINESGPIGILHFGDPHLDDDGTDLALFEQHIELIKTRRYLFGANVGDNLNNWIGRLARLYAEQSTSARQAWRIAEHYLTQIRWLYMIGGNHDLWSGAGDPLEWIARQSGSVYQPSETRLALSFQNGVDVTINARHDFAGHSQWNPAHGVAKAAQMGVRDNILICGHKHVSGYNVVKCPQTGKLSHCIQVASYKIFDRYAKERGFRDQQISPAVLTVINPDAQHETGLVTVHHDILDGVDYLDFLQLKHKAAGNVRK